MSPSRVSVPCAVAGRCDLEYDIWQGMLAVGQADNCLFAGGLLGVSSILAVGAHATGWTCMARRARIEALAAVGVSAATLVHKFLRAVVDINLLLVGSYAMGIAFLPIDDEPAQCAAGDDLWLLTGSGDSHTLAPPRGSAREQCRRNAHHHRPRDDLAFGPRLPHNLQSCQCQQAHGVRRARLGT